MERRPRRAAVVRASVRGGDGDTPKDSRLDDGDEEGSADGGSRKASFIEIIGRRVRESGESGEEEGNGGGGGWFPGWAPKKRVNGAEIDEAVEAKRLERERKEKVAQATAAAEKERKERERVRKAEEKAEKEKLRKEEGGWVGKAWDGVFGDAGKDKKEQDESKKVVMKRKPMTDEMQKKKLRTVEEGKRKERDANDGTTVKAGSNFFGSVLENIQGVFGPAVDVKDDAPASKEGDRIAGEELSSAVEESVEQSIADEGDDDNEVELTPVSDAKRSTGVDTLYSPPEGGGAQKAGGIFEGIINSFPRLSGAKPKPADSIEELSEGNAKSKQIVDEQSSPVASKPGTADSPELEDEIVKSDVAPEKKKLPMKEKAKVPLLSSVRGRASRRGDRKDNLAPVVDVSQEDIAKIRSIFGSETFFATETLSPPGGLIFRGNLRGEPAVVLSKLEKRLHDRLGDKYTLCLAEGEERLRPVVVVCPTARDRRPASPREVYFSIFVGAFTVSTCYARALFVNWQVVEFRSFFNATPEKALAASGGVLGRALTSVLLRFPITSISTAILAVVVLSQLVQRWMARKNNTRICLPAFLPSYQLGSFGSIVQIASPTPTRTALFDIALSGAATLILSSLLLLVIGLHLSTPAGALIFPVHKSMISSSMVVGWLTRTIAGGGQLSIHAPSSLVGLHPMAIVGANCLTIAALNLLPIRQLNGGRIVSAIYGRKTGTMASRVTLLFLLLASSRSNYLFVFLALVLFGPWSLDRPAKNELTEPNNTRAIVGYLFLLLMLSVLLPFPINIPLGL